jgi:hypothetical protein
VKKPGKSIVAVKTLEMMLDYALDAFDPIDRFDRTATTDQLMRQLESALSALEDNAFLIGGVPQPPLRVEAYFLLNGWPSGFTAEYDRQNCYPDDPVATRSRAIYPYEWAEAQYDPESLPRAAKVMRRWTPNGLTAPTFHRAGA